MNEKSNFKISHIVTVPRSFQEDLKTLFELTEKIDDSWDSVFELIRAIIRDKDSVPFYDIEIRYAENKE